MGLFSRRQPPEQIPACLRCHILDVPAGQEIPVAWWFLPGCEHVGHGRPAVCDPCKQQIDAGNRIPGIWNCLCGAAPVMTPVGG